MGSRFYNSEGEFQDVGLRTAREKGYYPSVTSIIGILDKPGVNIWRVKQMYEAARDTMLSPEVAHLSDDEIAGQAQEAYDFNTSKAAQLGTQYHMAIEKMFNGLTPIWIPLDTVNAIGDFIGDFEVIPESIEHGFVDESLGYAGTADLVGKWKDNKPVIIDWKTQGTKNGRVTFYKEWAAQLYAYEHAIAGGIGEYDLVSVAISTTEPGLLKYKVWDNKEMFNAFKLALELWRSPLCNNFPLKREETENE